MKNSFSLRRRLTLSMLLVFILGAGATALFLYVEVELRRSDLVKRTLHGQARDLEAGLSFPDCGDFRLTLDPNWAAAYRRNDSRFAFALYGPEGKAVVWQPDGAKPLERIAVPAGEDYAALRFIGVDESRYALVAKTAECGYSIVVGRKQPDPEVVAESVLLEESSEHFLAVIPFILLSLGLIWLISGLSLRPVSRASQEAGTIGPGDLSRRISLEGLPVEIRPLVEAVNAALDRLGQAYVAERQFTANAAHELRTPLSVLTLRLQRAKLDDSISWDDIERDCSHLSHMVNQLLNLARRENVAGVDSETTKINLSRVARQAAAQLVPLAEESGRRIEVNAPQQIKVMGRFDDLHDMMINLLTNALVHGEGTVTVTVGEEAERAVRRVVLQITDEGAGIPEAFREEVFKRFYKIKANSPGSGLGLAIVRQIVYSHDGEIEFKSGGGGCVRVTFPIP